MRLARVDSPRIFKVGFSGQSNFYVSVIDDEDWSTRNTRIRTAIIENPKSVRRGVHERNINLLDILSGKYLFELGA